MTPKSSESGGATGATRRKSAGSSSTKTTKTAKTAKVAKKTTKATKTAAASKTAKVTKVAKTPVKKAASKKTASKAAPAETPRAPEPEEISRQPRPEEERDRQEPREGGRSRQGGGRDRNRRGGQGRGDGRGQGRGDGRGDGRGQGRSDGRGDGRGQGRGDGRGGRGDGRGGRGDGRGRPSNRPRNDGNSRAGTAVDGRNRDNSRGGRPQSRNGRGGGDHRPRGGGGGRDMRRGRGGPRRGGGRRQDLLDSLKMLHRGISIDPHERLVLETTPDKYTTRVFDLVAPIGKGQRCLITSPPKAGKTMLLMDVALGLITNHPDVEVICLLVDERPEEVTYFRRGVACEVVASSNDMTPEDHVRTAEEAVVRAAETVVQGKDVVLLLDSITRLARAYNIVSEGSGRTLSGGIDASTMYGPRRIFGAARKIEGSGSLTILGTALVDTGSRMDEVIFQEFKGTGNTEVILSRNLAEKRIYPAIDILGSGSRKEEKLYSEQEVRALYTLRRFLADRKPDEAMLGLLKMMDKYPTNREVLEAILGGG